MTSGPMNEVLSGRYPFDEATMLDDVEEDEAEREPARV